MITEEAVKPGLDILSNLDEVLTKIKAKSPNQVIQRDNTTIWGKHLHKWDNTDWDKMLIPGFAVIQNYPEYVTPHQEKCIMRACETLVSHWEEHPRILDTKDYKSTAWSAMMSLWEVYRQVKNDEIVNSKALREKHRSNLFELKA